MVRLLTKSGSILIIVVVIHMDAFQPKCKHVILYFLKYIHKNEVSGLFGIERDL